ncbi:MAG: hypothetical protein LW817_02250 [Candidatus Caenarcaniphilales bacterium]|jgi:cytochrome c553|nr:hypothetical protein [Candidatus Caenarcaniphilales bacterium]
MQIALLILSLFLCVMPAKAFPEYLKAYKQLTTKKPELANCGLCHEAPGGGGDRNTFGQAFQKNKMKFTEKLMEEFPDRFMTLKGG